MKKSFCFINRIIPSSKSKLRKYSKTSLKLLPTLLIVFTRITITLIVLRMRFIIYFTLCLHKKIGSPSMLNMFVNVHNVGL